MKGVSVQSGPLKKVNMTRPWGELEWFLGAEDGIIEKHETDILSFIKSVQDK